MNKRKKVAWRKHRIKAKKLRIRRKESAAAGETGERGAS